MAKVSKKILAAAAGGVMVLSAAMIAEFEGVKYKPYYDPVGILTVCYGHTGSDIIKNKTYTQRECDALLDKDLTIVAKSVSSLIKVNIPDHTRAALYSFTYNVGTGAFSRSTLLKKLNSGDHNGACNELLRWVYAGRKQWKGLMTRREIEEVICLGDM